ncbi:uncharacterized protein K452DRAFT_110521 [Aplosporella prunicola CBS 121167]|uniref:Uncharacterized protein n=1 Tax=Aplosporella prunicola CBS 121167 TaxID=1176127 RepID=A0A6A6AZM3_9PEZI|nr:uncharacterized protein K452DRAFT_110521 [Aplosporella prunicola CBS 121167]KAF2137392.1 hypothetical protein K452DRAFT_110521 [Aplosporella prunicola CBS 121167]
MSVSQQPTFQSAQFHPHLRRISIHAITTPNSQPPTAPNAHACLVEETAPPSAPLTSPNT